MRTTDLVEPISLLLIEGAADKLALPTPRWNGLGTKDSMLGEEQSARGRVGSQVVRLTVAD
jgi:hypothetical protein